MRPLLACARTRPIAALAVGVCVALLAGCAGGISGSASVDPEAVPPAGKPLGYTPSDFDIRFALPDGADQIARDALSDIIAYYSDFYPSVFGHEFKPPTGGYFSIAPDEGNKSGCMSSATDDIIEDNAFYCSKDDEVAYWRPLLDRYASEYSDMQVGLVLAHELGHTIQAREEILDVRSIVAETQADCFAGVWAKSVADGNDPHFKFNPANLDQTLLAWALELPSEVGSDPDAQGQHGSAFDRVTAVQEGYEQGPTACRDNFNDDRVFTQAEFSPSELSEPTPGDAPYDDAVDFAPKIFGGYFADQVQALGGSWTDPELVIDPGSSTCTSDRTISYCQADNTVVVSNESELHDVYDKFGDFAMLTALGLAYSTAAIVELGYSASDPNAMPAASCLTGAVAAALTVSDNAYKVQLSPGDFDEATVMLLSADAENTVVDAGDVTAFQRMDAFRSGVKSGVGSCGVSG